MSMKVILEVDAANPPSKVMLEKGLNWFRWMLENYPADVSAIAEVENDTTSAMTSAAVAAAFAPAPPAATTAAIPTPPATAAAAPAVPTPPAPSAPAGLELDSTGAPWSERVCAGTKSKNEDGTWKKRKGVDAALYTQVMTEGRALAGSAPVATPTPPAPAAGVPVPPPPGVVPPPPGAVPPPPPADTKVETPILDAVQAITQAIIGQRLTMAELQGQSILHGYATLVELQNDPKALALIVEHFKQAGKL